MAIQGSHLYKEFNKVKSTVSFKIAICCCNYLYGEGIKRLIEQNGLDIDTTINCSVPEEIIETRPDLVIADFGTFPRIFPDASSGHGMRVLLLGTGCLPRIENDRLIDLVSKGLVGILPPMTDYSQFKKAVKSVVSGELWFERSKLQDLVSNMNRIVTKKRPLLTRMETEIVKLICQGHSNKEIMKRLNVTEQSVKSHLNRIYKKTGVSDRLQLAVFAMKTKQVMLNHMLNKKIKN
jgi:DNA-binding CsgD family transcriptional regulator